MIKKIDKGDGIITITQSSDEAQLVYKPTFISKTLVKVKQAVIKIPMTVKNTSITYEVHNVLTKNDIETLEVIDCFNNTGSEGFVCIDITDELQDLLNANKEMLTFKIKNASSSNIEFGLQSEVLINYISKKQFLEKNSYHEFDCGRAGSGKINLSTGVLQFTHNDISTGKGILPIKINHIYNSLLDKSNCDEVINDSKKVTLPSYNCSNGWKLNVQQFLVKEKDNKNFLSDGKTSGKFTYIDANGNQTEFLEQYYYLDDNDEKKYLTPEQIHIDLDGNISYTDSSGIIREVIKDIKSECGLTLSSQLEGFSGLNFLNQDIEEISTLKSEIQSINLTLRELELKQKSNAKTRALLATNTELNNLNNDIQDLNLTNEGLNLNYEDTVAGKKQEYTTNYRAYRDTSDARIYKNVGGENEPTTEEKNYKFLADQASDFIENANISFSKNLLTNRKEILSKNEDLYELNKTYTSEQIKHQLDQLDESDELINSQIDNYNTLKIQKTHNLEILQKQVPVHYLSDNKGSVLGFGLTNEENIYQLIMVVDSYENAIYINYNEFGNIKSIINASEQEIQFSYNDGLIEYIVDERNRKTLFSYENGNLSKITYPNGNYSSFAYDDSINLVEILSPAGFGVKLEYENNQVIKIEKITKTSKVTKTGKTTRTEVLTKDALEIEYYDYKSTILTDLNSKKSMTYVFDNLGIPVTIYENCFENNSVIGNVRAKSFDLSSKRKSFVIETLPYAEDMLSDTNFSGYEGETITESYLGDDITNSDLSLISIVDLDNDNTKSVYTLNNADLTKNILVKTLSSSNLQKIKSANATAYILSGWAKADSSWVDRKAYDYSDNNVESIALFDGNLNNIITSNLDDIKQLRRFELRAEIKYLNNGIETIVSQYCSFDWMNTTWQYCAFPVTINEKKYGTLTEIKVFFDYSNNTNSAEFFGMTLKEGKWEYAEYDENKQKTYSETSLSNSYTIYEYENKKLVKQTTFKNGEEYPTIYMYNSNGSIVRTIDHNNIVSENEYNNKGQVIKSYTYHKDNPSSKIYSTENILDEKGQKTGECNELGESSVEYAYIENTNIIASSRIDNNIVAYGYDTNDDTLLSTSTTIDNELNSNEYGYNFDMLTTLSHNDFNYNFEYDGFGRQTKILIENEEYLENKYETNKTTTKYKTNEVFESTTDNNNNITKVEYTDKTGNKSTLVENSYDTYGKLISVNDYSNSSTPTQYKIEYDKFGSVSKKTYSQNNKNIEISSINENDTKIRDKILIGNYSETISYYYTETIDKKLTKINFSNIEQSISYDKLGRINQTALGSILSKNYSYLQKSDHMSNLIASEWFGNDKSIKDSLKYTYDKKGNITSIKENGIEFVRYTYDDLSRLIREDNKKLNITSTYSYDKGGNIIERYEYPYTTIETNKLENGTRFAYSYPISGWKDQLVAYNNESFIYDEIGNPTTYRGKNLVWNRGRQLASFDDIEYKYNADGIRIAKTHNGVTTQFYVDGAKILAQDNGNLLTFNYGSEGIIGFNYVGIGEYYFKKNILGDIIAILDSNGQEIAKYVYDAWGNHKTYVENDGKFVDILDNIAYTNNGLNNKTIATINPFRYRGYYYDCETGLYYLNSRYYDSELGRFINSDIATIVNTTNPVLNGLNLYAYCLNNPVNEIDNNGFFIGWLIATLIIGAVIGGATATYNAVKNGASAWQAIGSFFVGAFTGALLGAATALGVGAGLAAAGIGFTFTIGTITFSTATALGTAVGLGIVAKGSEYLLTSAIYGTKVEADDLLFSLLNGALQGATNFGLGFFGGKFGAFDKLTPQKWGLVEKLVIADIINSNVRNFVTLMAWNLGETITRFIFVTIPSFIQKLIFNKIFD